MRVLIVIPAYNEEAALSGVLGEIGALARDGLVPVVVDDGSQDRTAEVARLQGARVLQLPHNLGIGGAVQAGLRLAHREHFDCAIQLDGDGQHPPGELAHLLEAHATADIVIGTRYLKKRGFQSTALRRVGSWWLRVVLRLVTGVRVTDPTSGFRLYGRRALALFDETYPYDFPEPESIAVARAAGLTIHEVQVTMRDRQGGRSSIMGLRSVYYMLKVTLAVALAYVRSRRRRGGRND